MTHSDLQTEIDRRIQAASVEDRDAFHSLSADIQQLVMRSPLPEDLEKAIEDAYARIEEQEGPGVTVAMRSSALGEDFAGTSFAGQYRSELNVSRENLFEAYREIVASKYGVPAMTYRLHRGLRDEDIAMCVGCMSMVDAIAGGVTYSSNPVDIRDDHIVITSAWGLPKLVVDGSGATDLFVIDRGDPPQILHREIPEKDTKFVPHRAEGVRRVALKPEEARSPSLSDEQATALSRLAVRIEEHYGVPQDIEWALRPDGNLVILQCRTLQQAEEHRIPTEENSAVESTAILAGGAAASPGVGAGPVFLIRREADTLQFPPGAVLVAAQALPRWASVLDRASAVVAERGSVAGHLANVAREFQVPAIFGLGQAMERLENGRVVTVDAETCRIYDGRREDLLRAAPKPRNLMKGSPVFEALEGASRHIIPLRLLDPDSPAFKPGNCKTFHDITRFCHEKSVQEMFRFGKDHHFPERSSKQLLGDVPMQWWVLNLDDGFASEVDGKYVRLDNIVSIPMHAIWDGISAMPWQGPPPVDGKGFMSVMFQATTNTALVPGVRSRYATRNYFMISRNYCCLNSRFGFHFSIVEALVSERSSENYISFQFKGGAADLERKQKRAFFIRDLLEELDFRVDVKEDTLMSRLEGRERSFMENRLKHLGFLIIHTRQLDMIMANPNTVQYYRNKIRNDLETLFPLPEDEGMQKNFSL
jgi:pyruvate,water dikinase